MTCSSVVTTLLCVRKSLQECSHGQDVMNECGCVIIKRSLTKYNKPVSHSFPVYGFCVSLFEVVTFMLYVL